METNKARTPFDLRRTFTCAVLAVTVTIGSFSLVANLMASMVAGTSLRIAPAAAQEIRVGYHSDDTLCAKMGPAGNPHDFEKPSVI